jgi:hypothetical protein
MGDEGLICPHPCLQGFSMNEGPEPHVLDIHVEQPVMIRCLYKVLSTNVVLNNNL